MSHFIQHSNRFPGHSRAHTRVWLGIAFVVALLVGLRLGNGSGQAAGLAQTSPQQSPLATVSVLPTPTPTPTSPLPPTLTPPPGLERWPTPTPTPFAQPVEVALALVQEESGQQRADLSLTQRLRIPRAGEQVEVIGLRSDADDGIFWVLVAEDGSPELAPDLSAEAADFLANGSNREGEEFELTDSLYLAYPFSRQFLWSGRFFDSREQEQLTVNLDLDGNPVELSEVVEAEEAALEERCGALDARLCAELLVSEPTDTRWIRLVANDEETAGVIADSLDEEELDYTLDGSVIEADLPLDVIFELAADEDNTSFILPFTPDQVLPLDTNLNVSLWEVASNLVVELTSQKPYPLLNYAVEGELAVVEITATQQITLDLTVDGIFTPATGPAAVGPAEGQFPVGNGPDGRYVLRVRYADPSGQVELEDSYTLLVSSSRLLLRPQEMSFTWPRYSTWLRLPLDAVWFVVQSRETDAQGERFDVTEEEFRAKAADFYDALEALGAEPLEPTEGVYAQDLFVPPWESWQVPAGEFVEVPVSGDSSFLFKWPDIRYFRYDGTAAAVTDLIADACVEEVWITGYTAAGQVLDECVP